MAEDTRDLDSTKASMDPYTLNNLVTKMRPVVKKVRLRVIQKLIKKTKLLRHKKGNAAQKIENEKKASRLVEEALKIKKIKIDRISKFALANTTSWEEIAKQGDNVPIETRILTRLSCHELLEGPVKKWRSEHDDWKALAAFLLSKGTGRRIKKKKKKSESPGGKSEDAKLKAKNEVETVVGASLQAKPTCDNNENKTSKLKLGKNQTSCTVPKLNKGSVKVVENESVSESDTGEKNPESSEEFSSSDSESLSDNELELIPRGEDIKYQKLNIKHFGIDSESSEEMDKTKTSNKVLSSIHQGDMVVEKVNLEELENLDKLKFGKKDVSFLFSQDTESSISDPVVRKIKRKDAFFINSDESDDTEGEVEMQVEEESENESISCEEDDQERKRQISIKGKNSIKNTFLGNLSRRNTKLSNHLGDKKGPMKKSEKSNRWQGKSSRGPSQTPAPQGKKLNKTKTSDKKSDSSQMSKSTIPDDLHPSWEASRKRKEQAKITIQPFQGKKILFDED